MFETTGFTGMGETRKFFEWVKSWVAIQICIGYFPDGRARHRTLHLTGIREDADPDAIASVVRALSAMLAHPVTQVRLIRTYRMRVLAATPPVAAMSPFTGTDIAGRVSECCAKVVANLPVAHARRARYVRVLLHSREKKRKLGNIRYAVF